MAKPATTSRVIRTDGEKRFLQGALTDTEISILFRVGARMVRERLDGVTPLRMDDGVAYYAFLKIAPLFVQLPEDVVERVLRLNHMQMPPMLRKEYWTGQAQMLKVKQAEGELFDAATVVMYVSELMKIFRMQLLLAGDTVERNTAMTERQRAALKYILDQALETTREECIRIFGGKVDDPSGQPGGSRRLTIEDEAADL